MTSHLVLVDLDALNWKSIAVAAFTVHMYAFGHTVATNSMWERYTAIDKGLKDIKQITVRYSFATQMSFAVGKALACTTAIACMAQLLPQHHKTPGGYATIAMFLSIFGVCAAGGAVWAQRPLPLILLNAVHCVGFALLGAAVLFITNDI